MASAVHRHRGGVVVAILLALLPALPGRSARADGETEDRLRLLARPGDEGHDAALAWWEEQAAAEKVTFLRRALASADAWVATVAAEAIGSGCLDEGELRRQMALLLAGSTSLFDDPPTRRCPWGVGEPVRAWGSADLAPFFRRMAAARPPVDEVMGFDAWHRVLWPRQVRDLVPLLDCESPAVFRSVLWHVAMCGEYDREDRHRAEVARGLLYGLHRLRAERAGAPVPPLDDVAPHLEGPPDGGLPEAYVELEAAYFPRGKDWKIRIEPDGPPGDLDLRSTYFWLRRWARDLTPSAKDLPYLLDLVEGEATGDPMLTRWAIGHMASMRREGGLYRVRTWPEGDDEIAAYAAAALAVLGEPERFFALLAVSDAAEEAGREGPADSALAYLLWDVDRPRARARWVNDVLGTDPLELADGGFLDADGRRLAERFHGLLVTNEDMARIANALWERGAPALTLAWFHGTVWPEGLTPGRARLLEARLRDLAPLSWKDGAPPSYLLPLLAMLEVRDEEGLAALLRRWVETQSPIRGDVLRWLARLGDATCAEAIVADWDDWELDEDRLLLGRVDSPTVRTFLEGAASGEDADRVAAALLALLMQSGLPEACARQVFDRWPPDLAADPVAEIRGLLREGRTADAVWRALQDVDPHLLGLVRDDRARLALERLRSDRPLGRYLEATVGLAIAGDTGARQALRSFLEDDRLWMLERVAEDAWSYLFGPWMREHWIERLDTNCCLGWEAMRTLGAVYPTLPFEDAYGGAGTVRTRRWIESQSWKRSRLLDGLVPAGP